MVLARHANSARVVSADFLRPEAVLAVALLSVALLPLPAKKKHHRAAFAPGKTNLGFGAARACPAGPGASARRPEDQDGFD